MGWISSNTESKQLFLFCLILHPLFSIGLGETQMIAFEDFHWHLNCFRCAACNTVLEGEGFILEEEETYCQDCGEQLE